MNPRGLGVAALQICSTEKARNEWSVLILIQTVWLCHGGALGR